MIIKCPACLTEHHGLKLRRSETKLCSGLKPDKKPCGHTLTRSNIDFQLGKYDKMSFISGKPKVKPKLVVIHVSRSRSAPPQAIWPFNAMSSSVIYVPNIGKDATWANPGGTHIRLPFKNLSVPKLSSLTTMSTVMQGLIIDFPALASVPNARKHFDAITVAMTTPKKAQDVTEAVGEAAAAMEVMTRHVGYDMLWGFDEHSGAGIDQIWWDMDKTNPHYLIVEAKGPTASLSTGAWGPNGYAQMEKLWVVDRLGRMANGGGTGATLAQTIIDGLALEVSHKHGVADPGGSKKYYGCVANSKQIAVATLSGLTVTAFWNGDGTLSGKAQKHAYKFP